MIGLSVTTHNTSPATIPTNAPANLFLPVTTRFSGISSSSTGTPRFFKFFTLRLYSFSFLFFLSKNLDANIAHNG